MATRPLFVPRPKQYPYVATIDIEFTWYPGFAKSQAQKSIESLHDAAAAQGIAPVLEISSKGREQLGIELSAFNLMFNHHGKTMSVECAFQGSKVFEKGGPYTGLYEAPSRDAKRDPRLQNSGRLIRFEFFGEQFDLQPTTAFYDWLYLHALSQNPGRAQQLLAYEGFSDIAFNPKRSLNCQARAAALYVALVRANRIEEALADTAAYLALLAPDPVQLTLDDFNADGARAE